MTDARCNGSRKDGSPCRTPALADGYCFAHSAAIKDRRDAGRVAGGKGRSKLARAARHLPPHLGDMQAVLIELVEEVRAGTMPARGAEVIGGLVSRLVELSKYADERGEAKELEARLTELEARLAESTSTVRSRGW